MIFSNGSKRVDLVLLSWFFLAHRFFGGQSNIESVSFQVADLSNRFNAFAAVVFALLLFENVRAFLKNGSGELALKFTFGLFVVAFLFFPLVTNRDYGSEVARLNIFNNGTNSLVGILQKIWVYL